MPQEVLDLPVAILPSTPPAPSAAIDPSAVSIRFQGHIARGALSGQLNFVAEDLAASERAADIYRADLERALNDHYSAARQAFVKGPTYQALAAHRRRRDRLAPQVAEALAAKEASDAEYQDAVHRVAAGGVEMATFSESPDPGPGKAEFSLLDDRRVKTDAYRLVRDALDETNRTIADLEKAATAELRSALNEATARLAGTVAEQRKATLVKLGMPLLDATVELETQAALLRFDGTQAVQRFGGLPTD